MRQLQILGCCALLVAPWLLADEHSQSFESGEQRVALVELFTSEGCSSCPPADRWLSGLKNDPNVVYTPGLFKDGEEWRTRRSADIASDNSEATGSLSLTVAGGNFEGYFASASSDTGNLQLSVAILGMNLETQVRAGENRGKTLYHDFVVVGFSSVELEYEDGNYTAAGKLPDTFVNATDLAIVAWISNGEQQAPLQAVGGFIPGT